MKSATPTNRREKPNIRFTAKFYTYAATNNAEPTVLTTGELEQVFSLHAIGYGSLEKPLKPQESQEGDRTISEQSQLFICFYTRTLEKVTHGMYCYVSQLSKLFQVNGDALDPMGDKKKLHIHLVGNVTQDIRQKIPGALL